MTELSSQFERSFSDAADALAAFRKDQGAQAALTRLADWLAESLRHGHKALIAGNGGSMADAMHFAEEWTGRFRKDRRPYPAMALGGDPTHLTCVGNDYGFDYVFSRGVEAFAQPGDVLILLSTSGNSNNLILAAEAAKLRSVPVVGFLGRGGGKLLPLCDLVVMAPGETSDRIQEIHMMALHVLIEVVERVLAASDPESN